MTLISTIVTDAFRESNILPLGQVPNVNQGTEALRLLTQLFGAIYGSDAGEVLADWPLGYYDQDNPYLNSDYHLPIDCLQQPPINQRLIVTNTAAITVYLTTKPQNGSRMAIVDPFNRLATVPVTLDANGRTIEGTPTILLNVAGTNREWFYRADLGTWMKLTDLTADDEMPFPADFDIFFSILLAMRLNPRYGRTIDAQTQVMLKSQRQDFVARYLQSRPLEIDDSISWPFMSRQGYDRFRSFSSNAAFNRGNWEG